MKPSFYRRGLASASLLLFSMLITQQVHSQSMIQSSGGDFFGVNGSLSFSVGQVFYSSQSSDNGSLYTGIQVPYEISAITAITGNETVGNNFTVFPNPFTDRIILHSEATIGKGLAYQLIDMSGRLVISDILENSSTEILLHDLEPSMYLLRIENEGQMIETIKIIKQ